MAFAGAFLVGSLGMLVLEARALGVRVKVIRDRFGDSWLQVRGVHPTFAAALEARIRGDGAA